jgi:hypothetical protein
LQGISVIYLPVQGYEGSYEVSDQGTVRSIDRTFKGQDGATYKKRGRVLKTNRNKNVEYQQVSLWNQNKGSSYYVHRLVATAHKPNPTALPEVNHKDGNRQNNLATNLEWTDSTGNSQHAIITGLKVYTNRLTKQEFTECLFDVINGESYASLCTRVPYKVPFLSTKVRSIARELNVENELNESLYLQKVERAKENGAKHK